MNRNHVTGVALGVLVPLGVLAANLTIPHAFTAGTPVRASEMNANFAAVQTAVNSKLDAAGAVTGGSRLKVRGFRSSDGAQLPLLKADNFGDVHVTLFDSMLGVYCIPQVTSDRVVRCVPYWFPSKVYFTDAACTYAPATLLYTGEPNPPAGLPPPTTRYLGDHGSFADGTAYREIYTLTPYMGVVYEDQGGVACAPIALAAGTAVYQRGAVVPPTTFVTMSPATF